MKTKCIVSVVIVLFCSVALAATITKIKTHRKLIGPAATNTLNNFINNQICNQVNTDEGKTLCDPSIPDSVPNIEFVNKMIDTNNDGIDDTQRWMLLVRNKVVYDVTSIPLP